MLNKRTSRGDTDSVDIGRGHKSCKAFQLNMNKLAKGKAVFAPLRKG